MLSHLFAIYLVTNFIDNLPTSGLVVINFDVQSWTDITRGKTELTIFPRDLKQ